MLSGLNPGRRIADTPGVSSKLLQRAIVGALVVAAIGGALAAYLVSRHQLDKGRTDRVDTVRRTIVDAVRRRAYYLEDVADMVGVHDDADATEFSRYAHVRGRNEDAVVAVQWIRRSPSGDLVPPSDIGPDPELVRPIDRRDHGLGDAASSSAAASVIRAASLHKRIAASAPVKLANGDAGFYLAVPVVAHRFSGEVSSVESESAVVGLIDAQRLVADAIPQGAPTPLQLRDRVTPLASVGAGMHHAVSAAVATAGRPWTLTVDGGALTPIERSLPWLILLGGLGLALAVHFMLRNAAQRRDAALSLAGQRSIELAASLKRVEQTNLELEQARADAERLSREDPVTGFFNRRHFGEVLMAELGKPRGEPGPAVLLLDLDFFKAVNDEHGHLMGDAVLQTVADRIASVLREDDCLARWGGEEFAVLAPEIDCDGVMALAERAREALASSPVEIGETSIALTLSVGAALAGDGLATPDSLVDAADQALYEAKAAGRNCVRVWALATSPQPTPSRA
jgi:diguanylate cyclase (GGDEF)-like protein